MEPYIGRDFAVQRRQRSEWRERFSALLSFGGAVAFLLLVMGLALMVPE